MTIQNTVVAIMQPYLFPNINYFQLAAASDIFVFYDDVHFMKKGWCHRNTILLNGDIHLFTCPLRKASQNKLICDIEISDYDAFKAGLLTKLYHAYRKYEYWNQLDDFLGAIFQDRHTSLSDFTISGVVQLARMADIRCTFITSSSNHAATRSLTMTGRLSHITKSLGGKTYLNKESGRCLYSPPQFQPYGIDLAFLSPYNLPNKISAPFPVNFFPNISILHQLASINISLISELIHDFTVYKAP